MEFKITQRKTDKEKEKRILINLITNTEYCRSILPLLSNDLLQIAYAKKIIRWIKKYWEEFNEAPKLHIQDIFNLEKEKLKEEESELISDFLFNLSREYDETEEKNTEYLIKSSLPYIKSRSYIQLGENLKSAASLNNIKECEDFLISFKKIEVATSGTVNPHDPNYVKKAMEAKQSDILFNMPGKLGEIITIERGRLIAFLGAAKIGKTHWLHEIGVQGLLNGYKVFEVNCEMSNEKMALRHYKRIGVLGKEPKTYLFSVADCLFNQQNTCNKPERINHIPLLNDNGERPEWEESNKDYKPCVVCRNKNSDFQLESWYEEVYREGLEENIIVKTTKSFDLMYGSNNYRLKCYPKFTADCNDIIRDLEILELTENFRPDILIVDYADILRPTYAYKDTRHSIDEIWKMLGKIASERNIAVITASQLNRSGMQKKSAKTTDIAEDIRKVANVDSMIIINQTPLEKKRGIQRLSVGVLRDEEFHVDKEVTVFQNFNVGQPLLDSEIGNILE